MNGGIDRIKERLATSSTGYAAVIDGVMTIGTAVETPNWTALNALYRVGISIPAACTDPECNCYVRILRIMRPDISIVSVKMEICNG